MGCPRGSVFRFAPLSFRAMDDLASVLRDYAKAPFGRPSRTIFWQ